MKALDSSTKSQFTIFRTLIRSVIDYADVVHDTALTTGL